MFTREFCRAASSAFSECSASRHSMISCSSSTSSTFSKMSVHVNFNFLKMKNATWAENMTRLINSQQDQNKRDAGRKSSSRWHTSISIRELYFTKVLTFSQMIEFVFALDFISRRLSNCWTWMCYVQYQFLNDSRWVIQRSSEKERWANRFLIQSFLKLKSQTNDVDMSIASDKRWLSNMWVVCDWWRLVMTNDD